MSYGAGGGGFMSQGGGSSPSKGGRKPSSLRPVTIHQLLNADQPHGDADFEIDGVELRDVMLVGCVRNSTTQATHYNFVVEDGTGQFDVRFWLPSGADAEGLNLPDTNQYARFIGPLKTFQNKRHVNAQLIKPVTDMNEILYHPLACVAAHLYHTRGPPPRLTGTAAGPAMGGAARMQGITGASTAAANPYTNGAGAADAGSAYTELPDHQRRIMHFVESQSSESREGINVAAITRGLGSSADRVRQEIERLIEEGYLYTTIDEDHVCSTAS